MQHCCTMYCREIAHLERSVNAKEKRKKNRNNHEIEDSAKSIRKKEN